LLLAPEPSYPQGETTSAIAGQVTDETGAAIRGAKVSITNVGNGLKRSVETDEAGRFNFPQLIPGTYSVQGLRGGFSTAGNPGRFRRAGPHRRGQHHSRRPGAAAEVTVHRASSWNKHRECQYNRLR